MEFNFFSCNMSDLENTLHAKNAFTFFYQKIFFVLPSIEGRITTNSGKLLLTSISFKLGKIILLPLIPLMTSGKSSLICSGTLDWRILVRLQMVT